MSVTLLIMAVGTGVAAILLVVSVVTRDFAGWKFSEKVAAGQAVLPAAVAAFALNALFGTSIETPSKIIAAVLTLIAGLLAIVKQIAATMESHPETAADVGLTKVLNMVVLGKVSTELAEPPTPPSQSGS
jgi:hypothetical protein